MRLIPPIILRLEPRHLSLPHCPDADVGATDEPGMLGVPRSVYWEVYTKVGIPAMYHGGYPCYVTWWVSPAPGGVYASPAPGGVYASPAPCGRYLLHPVVGVPPAPC